jgi:hypothetical protein
MHKALGDRLYLYLKVLNYQNNSFVGDNKPKFNWLQHRYALYYPKNPDGSVTSRNLAADDEIRHLILYNAYIYPMPVRTYAGTSFYKLKYAMWLMWRRWRMFHLRHAIYKSPMQEPSFRDSEFCRSPLFVDGVR